ADAVADHQRGHAGAVDQDDSSGNGLGVGAGASAEAGGGDEHALIGLIAMECAHESLYLGSADAGIERVSLCLDVDTTEAEGVLVDDPVDAAVIGQLRTLCCAFCAAVAHGHDEV